MRVAFLGLNGWYLCLVSSKQNTKYRRKNSTTIVEGGREVIMTMNGEAGQQTTVKPQTSSSSDRVKFLFLFL